MKKILFIIILISLIAVGYFSFKKNPFLELGYSKEDLVTIETLSVGNRDILLDYEYNSKYIDLINSPDFLEYNLYLYIEFINKYNLSLEDTIFILNNKYNTLDIYDEITLALMKEEYYIHSLIDRYLSYIEKNNASYSDTISNVNSNIDYAFYTNTVETDLTKNYLILVNKYNYLSSNYTPANLVSINSNYGVTGYLEETTYNAFVTMADDAALAGVNLYAYSPYRSYSVQYSLYNRYASKDGVSLADTYSARAGHSEHQTGLAVDISRLGGNLTGFENTNEFKWLKDNSYKYGFIIRYPEGKEYITGYQYEPWHYRYLGVEVATAIHNLNITFEEYYAYYVK